jgi:glycosyltransferase involved in cell wall biosynthesis
VEETRAGVLFPPGDRKGFATRLAALLCDEPTRRQLGANGRRAVTSKYRWETDEAVFLDTIRRLRPPRRADAVAASLA